MATRENLPIEPAMPFLMINKYYMRQIFDARFRPDWANKYNTFDKIWKKEFDSGKFKENAYIIDANCWKFPIIDVMNLGKSFDFWDLWWWANKVKVQYIYDTPIKMTFEEARDEIAHLILKKRWWRNGTGDSEKAFRARMAKATNMFELIVGFPSTNLRWKDQFPYEGGISFYGKWVD